MADSHPTDEGHDSTNDTEGQSEPGPKDNSRRTFLKTVGVAAAFAGTGSMVGEVSAAQDANYYLNQSGEVHVPAGEYSWDGSDLSLGSSEKLIGDGNPGDVVFNLESGTMYGTIRGHLENITVRGHNPEAGSGLRIQPGATIDGFVWPEGGQQERDMGLYTSDGGNDRVTIRNSGWAWMVNNGAYVDKPPVTIENCVAANNNIAGIRVGHRDGTSSGQTTYIRNTIIAVTRDVLKDSTQSAVNARGLRVRHPANVVVENCWFVYLDVDKGGDLVVFNDNAAGSDVTIRNCAFYNDSSGDLIRDKTGGDVDLTIENCTVEGSGSREIGISYSGSGFTEASAEYPLPSQVTGRAAADEIKGIGPGIGPWTEDGAATSGSTNHSLVLHASPDNSQDVDVSFTVDGSISYGSEAESDTDTIVSNDDGTVTATSIDLNPDALDSYWFDGSIVDYSVPADASVDVAVDGTTTSFTDLVDDGSTDDGSGDDSSSDDSSSDDSSSDDSSSDDSSSAKTRELLLHASPLNAEDLNVSFTVDGSIDYGSEAESGTDTIKSNSDGTVTATSIDLNPDALDSYSIEGPVVDYEVEDGGMVDLSVDGKRTTFPQLVVDDSAEDDAAIGRTREFLLQADPDNTYDADFTFTVDGSIDYGSEAESGTDTIKSNSDGTVTATTINLDPGALDSYLVDGPLVDYTLLSRGAVYLAVDGTRIPCRTLLNKDLADADSTDSGSTDSSSSGTLPHRISIVGSSTKQASEYTFTVSGDVVRDTEASHVSDDSSPWDQMEDIAKDGKVIGIVGSGVDAYRFDGKVTDVNVNGTAKVKVEEDV